MTARTLAVTSGKGGVGKTFITANLACADNDDLHAVTCLVNLA